ncbi:carbamoyltransferase HypF [Mucilaginibacter sp. UR6-11]|uniref:carbamoyltransferase HypF n=1 Tax=Mucilaginibacter sp. UR6-11 TaxID=1435644 RepID=UPI001E55E4A1|nr:carbamoyltransferase HypF [Mucilaginibacter sp. UR6-11]MCC8423517.1 carbamoyltransferase HypF [Mucilaginibacter sp. UR6-11]
MPETYHIHFNGIVQGVGFRPLVYQLATAMGLNGYVKNDNNGVNILFNADEEKAKLFFKKIKSTLPPKANVTVAELKKNKELAFKDFSIKIDSDTTETKVMITPDMAICESCRSELNDENNRRYRYPFITCTQCGPRYSIISELPYERHSTTMNDFTMCKACSDEYEDIACERFFSQTNSCGDCGIKLTLHGNRTTVLSTDTEKVLFLIKNYLQQGKIIAVKGIGGHLLLCDANNEWVIQLLRNRKQRPSKPLAILCPDVETACQNFELNNHEKSLLESTAAPIVLLYPKRKAADILALHHIAPNLRRIGVMLPYSPLLELIAQDFKKPLIATSGNISGSPIIYRDEDALEHLFGIADFVVSYNREIVVPQDDSVVQVSRYTNQQIILRRSRGYAPSFLNYTSKTKRTLLSTGAFLKSSFTLGVNGNVFVSQFLGSGESYESQLMYKHTLNHWLKMYATQPAVIIADTHPDYFSLQYAVELAERYRAELRFVQHHRAHFAAALAEHDLLHANEPVLGIIWDGTGFGDDGNIWGGEFFKYENNQMQRSCHFDYFPTIAGDKMAIEPRVAALCIANGGWPHLGRLKEKFTDTEWNNYQMLINNTSLFSSSVGRLFDAVASLLGICDKQSYEGEAAMYVQSSAEEYININGFVTDEPYLKLDLAGENIPTTSLIQGVIMDIEKNRSVDYIAARFHYSLVCLVDIMAQNLGVKKICFSGGVFQNILLVDWIQHEYNHKYDLYFHKNLSPNDENISFGQLVFEENRIETMSENIGIDKLYNYTL